MLKIARPSIRINRITRITRTFSSLNRVLAKNDTSTIDSFKLPSQTSINEWEFKYDFVPKVAEPKIPPVSPEAVKQDIAETKKSEVEQELLYKELNSSVKVEANDAKVVHGGESVSEEPEYIQDLGSDPVDASSPDSKPKHKTANADKYVQSSLNPEINKPSLVNLGHENEVDHKTATVETPGDIDDTESPQSEGSSATSPGKILGLLGLGGIAGYFLFNGSKEPSKK
ncbi:hypothetical protein JCM33374_g6648 [Metschnikowia sp. JCM 33374]|nr:hypothetical protein JCM33374_g6648 [Metschnikowia sp. JCM 33374]